MRGGKPDCARTSKTTGAATRCPCARSRALRRPREPAGARSGAGRGGAAGARRRARRRGRVRRPVPDRDPRAAADARRARRVDPRQRRPRARRMAGPAALGRTAGVPRRPTRDGRARRRRARPRPLLPRLAALRRGDHHRALARCAARDRARRRAATGRRARTHPRGLRPRVRALPADLPGQRRHALRRHSRARTGACSGPGSSSGTLVYDFEAAAARIRASAWPQAARVADENVLRVPGAEEAIDFFERMEAAVDRPL